VSIQKREAELFGQKIAFHLEPADLAAELIGLGFVLFPGFVALLKDLGGISPKDRFHALIMMGRTPNPSANSPTVSSLRKTARSTLP